MYIYVINNIATGCWQKDQYAHIRCDDEIDSLQRAMDPYIVYYHHPHTFYLYRPRWQQGSIVLGVSAAQTGQHDMDQQLDTRLDFVVCDAPSAMRTLDNIFATNHHKTELYTTI